MEGNPDLYGPFWIATTVVVILFLTGTISQYLHQDPKDERQFAYDFKLLSGRLAPKAIKLVGMMDRANLTQVRPA